MRYDDEVQPCARWKLQCNVEVVGRRGALELSIRVMRQRRQRLNHGRKTRQHVLCDLDMTLSLPSGTALRLGTAGLPFVRDKLPGLLTCALAL